MLQVLHSISLPFSCFQQTTLLCILMRNYGKLETEKAYSLMIKTDTYYPEIFEKDNSESTLLKQKDAHSEEWY